MQADALTSQVLLSSQH